MTRYNIERTADAYERQVSKRRAEDSGPVDDLIYVPFDEVLGEPVRQARAHFESLPADNPRRGEAEIEWHAARANAASQELFMRETGLVYARRGPVRADPIEWDEYKPGLFVSENYDGYAVFESARRGWRARYQGDDPPLDYWGAADADDAKVVCQAHRDAVNKAIETGQNLVAAVERMLDDRAAGSYRKILQQRSEQRQITE